MSIKRNICDYAEVITNMFCNGLVTFDDFVDIHLLDSLKETKNIRNKTVRIYTYYELFGKGIDSSENITDMCCQHLWLYGEIVTHKLFTAKKFQKYLKNCTIKMNAMQFVFAMQILLRRKR